MVSFILNSNRTLTIKVVEKLKEKEFQGFPVIIDALTDSNFDYQIFFEVDKNIGKQKADLIKSFCSTLPYEHNINFSELNV